MSERIQQFMDYVSSLEKEAATLREEVVRLTRISSAVGELVESLQLYEQWTASGKPLTEAVKKRLSGTKGGHTRYSDDQVDKWVGDFQAGVPVLVIAAKYGCAQETVRHRMARLGVYASQKDLALAQATPEEVVEESSKDDTLPF